MQAQEKAIEERPRGESAELRRYERRDHLSLICVSDSSSCIFADMLPRDAPILEEGTGKKDQV